jgi:peptidyl-prolyl cis-trans isomerase B (cyclophilin B)
MDPAVSHFQALFTSFGMGLDRLNLIEMAALLLCHVLTIKVDLEDGKLRAYMSKQYSSPPPMSIDTAKTFTATLETSRGTIVCDLFPKDAPATVNNFVFLAREGFYDGTKFHRVINDFMVQGGDPTGKGTGGPGYRFEDEVKGNPRKHKVGTLSMANAGPHTNGSQFFITHIATEWLDGKHTVFGQVRDGQDVVNAIKQGDELKSVTVDES